MPKYTIRTNRTISEGTLGDIYIGPRGTEYVEDIQIATIQQITERLRFFKGESFVNVRAGIPYFEYILTKPYRPKLIKNIIKQAIESVRTVRSVDKIDIALNRQTRIATVNFTAILDDNRELNSRDFGPLIINVNI